MIERVTSARERSSLLLLRRCTAALGRAVTATDVASVVVTDVIPALGGLGGSMFELDDEHAVLRLVATENYPTSVVTAYAEMDLATPLPPTDAVRTGEPVLLGSVEEAERRYPALVRSGQIVADDARGRAWAHLPLHAGGDRVGVLILAFADPQPFDEGQVALLTATADVAAQALSRSRLRDEERRALQLLAVKASEVAESEELIRTIAENAVSALLMMDEHGHATYVNHAWVQVTGFAVDDMRGKRVHDWVHHSRPDGTPFPVSDCPIERALPERRWIEPYEDAFVRTDGTYFPVRAAASPIMREGRPVGTVVEVRDISEEKERERRLRDAEARVRFLAEASEALSRSFAVEDTLTEVARLAVPRLADYCFFDLVDENLDLTRVATAHHRDPSFPDQAKSFVPSATNTSHPTRRAVTSGEPVLVSEVDDAWIEEVAESPDHAALMRGQDVAGVMAVPVASGRRRLGVLTLVVTGSRRYGDDDVGTAAELARRAAVAIENARLFQRSEFQRSLLEAQGEASVDGLLVVDAEGRIRSFNSRYIEIWGIPKDTLAQGDDAALTAAEERLADRAGFIARVRELYERRETSREELRLRDGRTIERYGSPVVADDGTYHGYLWSFRDITERRRAAEALALSEERFRSLVSATTQIVWTTDTNGAFTERSRSWEAFTGQRPDDYLGAAEAGFDAIHPADRDEIAQAWAALLSEPRDDTVLRYRLRRHDGVYRRVVARPVPLHAPDGSVREWVGSVTDAEEELAAQEELDRQFEVTKAITENATSALVMLDQRGLATYANDAWEAMTGFGTDEILGTSTHDAVHHTRPDGTTYPKEECPLVRALPEGGRIEPYEDVLIRKDGTFFPARVSASPIVTDGRVVGTVLEVQDITEERHARTELERLVGLEREARHRAELLERNARHLAAATTAQEVARSTVADLEAGGVEVASVRILSDGRVRLLAATGVPPERVAEVEIETLEEGDSPSTVAMRRNEVLVYGTAEEIDAEYPHASALREHMGSNSMAVFPLHAADGSVIGALAVIARHTGWMDDERRQVLSGVAEQCGLALERAQLHEREIRGRRRAEFIAEVMSELERVRGVRRLAARLVDLLVPRIADYATIEAPSEPGPLLALRHRDPELTEVFRALRTQRFRLPSDDPRSVARVAGGQAQLISVIDDDVLASFARDDETHRLLSRLEPRSHISVPVHLGGSDGVLVLGLSDPRRRPYENEDLAFVRDLASRVGLRFENARLQEEEHRIALRLQRALLPDDVVRRPRIEVSAHYEAGSDLLEVGGDWYDTFDLPDGKIGLVVGDVVGHGVEAAAAMGRIRSALAALAQTEVEPGRVLTHLARFAAGSGGVEFATVCYVVLDPATRQVVYASAGHPPILVVGATGDTLWIEDGRSTPIVAGTHDLDRPQASTTLDDGSMFLLYSDGLVERRGERIGIGLARLERVAVEVRDLPAGDAGARILEEMRAVGDHDDDVVVLCVRLQPSASPLHLAVPAVAYELRTTRSAVREWLDAQEIDPEVTGEVLLVLGEACANAVEHAYQGGPPGEIEIDLSLAEDAVVVRVHDDGRWRKAGAGHDRGRGTGIMQALTVGFERVTGPDGTTVTAMVPTGRQQDG